MYTRASDARNALAAELPIFAAFSMTMRPKDRPVVTYEALIRLSLVAGGTFSMGDVAFNRLVKEIHIPVGDRLLFEFDTGRPHYTDIGVRYFGPTDSLSDISRNRTVEFAAVIEENFGRFPVSRLVRKACFADGMEITQDPVTPRGVIWSGEHLEFISDDLKEGYVYRRPSWITPAGTHGTLKFLEPVPA